MAALVCSRMRKRNLHELEMQVLGAAFPKLTTLNLECVHLERNAWALMYLTSLEHLRRLLFNSSRVAQAGSLIFNALREIFGKVDINCSKAAQGREQS